MNELFTALSKAQSEFQTVIKGNSNPFFKSKYADLATIWESIRPVLHKHGLCVLQTTDVVDNTVVLNTILGHSSGQSISGAYPIKPVKDDPQAMGSAMTYARRYALSAILGIVSDVDDDGEAAMNRVQKTYVQNASKVVQSV